MKKVIAFLLCALCIFSFCACAQKADTDEVTEEEIERLLDGKEIGDEVDLGGFSEEEQGKIAEKFAQDGFEFVPDEKNPAKGTLQPKNPVSGEEMSKIISDAKEKGTVDLNGLDKAQKQQVEQKLEEEGFKPKDGEGSGEGETPVETIPELTEAELKKILSDFGILDNVDIADDYVKEADLSAYPKNQLAQIRTELGLRGVEIVEEGGKTFLKAMVIHIDEVKDNEYE